MKPFETINFDNYDHQINRLGQYPPIGKAKDQGTASKGESLRIEAEIAPAVN
jgi:hypothetical protein